MQITVIDKRGREGSWDRKQPTPIHHSLKFEKKFKKSQNEPNVLTTTPIFQNKTRGLQLCPVLTRVSYGVPSF